jgi:hypothetical protein
VNAHVVVQIASRCALVQLDPTFASNNPVQQIVNSLQSEHHPHGLDFCSENLVLLRERCVCEQPALFVMIDCRYENWTFTASDFATSAPGRFYFAMTNSTMQELLNERLEAAKAAYLEYLDANPDGTYAEYMLNEPVT